MKRLLMFFAFLLLFIVSGYTQNNIKVSDQRLKWLHLNFQGCLITNTNFSNLSKQDIAELRTDNYNETVHAYSKEKSNPICFGFLSGLEVSLGRQERNVQFVLSVNYELTNSSFNRNTNKAIYISHYGQTAKDSLFIKRQMQCIGASFGAQFWLSKKLKASVLFNTNQIQKQTDIKTGYYVLSSVGFALPGGYVTRYDSSYYNNTKFVSKGSGNRIICSFRFRCGYDLNPVLSIFILGNIGIGFKVPWWMTGIQIYPFRKLRS